MAYLGRRDLLTEEEHELGDGTFHCHVVSANHSCLEELVAGGIKLHLYPTLLDYYDQSIDTLQSAAAIRALRQQYRESTGYTFHEPEVAYTARPSVTGFWNRLNRWMI